MHVVYLIAVLLFRILWWCIFFIPSLPRPTPRLSTIKPPATPLHSSAIWLWRSGAMISSFAGRWILMVIWRVVSAFVFYIGTPITSHGTITSPSRPWCPWSNTSHFSVVIVVALPLRRRPLSSSITISITVPTSAYHQGCLIGRVRGQRRR
jgi:hypothetical protein